PERSGRLVSHQPWSMSCQRQDHTLAPTHPLGRCGSTDLRVRGAVHNGKDVPLAGCALEGRATSVRELDLGSNDKIAHRARDKHLIGWSHGRDARGDMYRKATDVIADHLALTGVHTAANPYACLFRNLIPDRAGTADRSGRSIEGGEKNIPGTLDLLPTVRPEAIARDLIVGFEHLSPTRIAQAGRCVGGIDDVGEDHSREH